jgi:hypothetical protein
MKKRNKRSDIIRDFILYVVLLYVFLFLIDSTNLAFPVKAILGAVIIAGSFVYYENMEKPE